MKTYSVTIPIAGHIVLEIEAESAEDAIDQAFESDQLTLDNISDWDALKSFNEGNVCYCPRPWEAEAELAFGEEPDE